MNAPQGYEKIKVHLVFACKPDGHYKASLVAGDHLTPNPINSIYSGCKIVCEIRKLLARNILHGPPSK